MKASPAPTVSTTRTGVASTPGIAGCAERHGAPGAQRQDDDRGSRRQPPPGRALGLAVGIDPPQVLVTDLDDVAALDQVCDAGLRGVTVGNQRRSHVGIEAHGRRDAVSLEQRGDRQAPRFAHGGDRPGVHQQRRRHLGRTGKPPLQIECVRGRAVVGDRRDRGRRAFGRDTSRNELDTRGFQVRADAPAGFVVRDMGQEVDVTTQPGQPDRDVERAAADMLDGAAPIDPVDQRFTDHQRAAHRLRV